MNLKSNQGKLSIAATPIGNLQDISPNLQNALQEADVIAAEDTRRTKQLCTHLGIQNPHWMRFDETKEIAQIPALLALLEEGKNIVLVSDAGTPCISDPGWRVVFEARQKKHKVYTIAGPSAITSALSISGFPATPFTFYGFLEKKKTKSLTQLTQMFEQKHASVFFESPYRIEKTLLQMNELEPSRMIFMVREMTKMFEESYFGTVSDLMLQKINPKGEWTIVISPNHDKFKA